MKRLTVVFMAVAAFMLFAAGVAQAVAPVKKATGSIVMSGPKQAATFEAFQRTSNKGSVTYTNFELANESDVFVPNLGTGFTLSLTNVFDGATLYPGPFTHTVTFDSYEPQSPTVTTFVGHGFYDADPAWTESIVGSVHGTHVQFSLIPDDGGLKYGWTEALFDGTIESDGTMSGSAGDNYLTSRTYDWAIDAVASHSVFSYTAAVDCVAVSGSTASFGFVAPAPVSQHVMVTMTDGGSSGAGNDTWQHLVAQCTTVGGQAYPITAGNLTVFG